MHVVDDPAQRKAMLEGMLAWNTDFHFLYIDVAGHGLLPVEAERQGKVVVTTELGGGGLVTRRVHALARARARERAAARGHARGRGRDAGVAGRRAVILDGRDPRNYLFAPDVGDLRDARRRRATPVSAGRAGRPASTRSSSPSGSPTVDRGAARRRDRRDPRDLVDGAGRQRPRLSASRSRRPPSL